ncbi:MAG TPA: CHC2 zinc finger domain-containing protein [Chthoniobacterales bacterium]|nr:CHC2 zinc finger domain-containing protein [Chthoniobacterales bacterium]
MISEIKNRFTIPQIGKEFFPDWVPAKSCRSPFRPDHTPSFSVYHDGKLFMDFATGDRGDVIDFYALANGINPPQALNELWDRLRDGTGHCERHSHPQKMTEQKKPTPDDPFCLPYRPTKAQYIRMKDDCERLLTARGAIEFMAERRSWEVEVVKDLAFEGVLGLSADGYITFNFLSGSKSRWLDAKGKRQFCWNFGKPWFWRGDLILQAKRSWIGEGETKLITALCWGWEKTKRVIALPAASFNPAPWAFLFMAKEIAYVLDPDPAGKAAAKRVKTALGPVVKSMVVLHPQDLRSK